MPFSFDAFDPRTVKGFTEAFDEASVQLREQPPSETMRNLLAKKIIDLAQRGLTDPACLRDAAVTYFNAASTAPSGSATMPPRDGELLGASFATDAQRTSIERMSAEDLRQVVRLCIEEANSTSDQARKVFLAERAFGLAQLAEKTARDAEGRSAQCRPMPTALEY